jgi:GrpB-like predicted nucleotidyltransferase (UPF0157 family)
MTNPLPGLAKGLVILADPSPEWANLYVVEADSIRATLGPAVVAIEHYGSTSIPGIKAKPIIDLLVGVPRLGDALNHIRAMEALGYDYAAHAGVPDHHIFGKGTARTHLAHFVEHEGASWGECLRFRDALRADLELAWAYERLKVELAVRYPQDRATYTAGKTAFVTNVLATHA